MESLRALHDPTLGDLLVEALGHLDSEVVKQALSAIRETAGPRTAARLALGLSHEAWDVRQAAAHLLGTLGDADACEALTSRLEAEEDEMVRSALQEALEEGRGEG